MDHILARVWQQGLAGLSQLLSERAHLLKTLGYIAHECRQAYQLAGLITQRHDGEFDRDSATVLSDGRKREGCRHQHSDYDRSR